MKKAKGAPEVGTPPRRLAKAKGLEKATPQRLQLLSDDDAEFLSLSETGGLVDESFCREEVVSALAGKVTPEKLPWFLDAFGEQLGLYRSLQEEKEGLLSPTQELQFAIEAKAFVQETRRRLEHLPSHLRSELNAECWKRRRELFLAFQKRLDVYLAEAWELLTDAEHALRPHTGKRGPRGTTHRDRFLYQVAELLKLAGVKKAGDRATVASAALLAVGVECPEEPRDCEKLIAGYAKLRG